MSVLIRPTAATTDDPRWLASLPVPVIRVAGEPLPRTVSDRLAFVRVRRELSRPTACEFEVEATQVQIEPGAALEITVTGATLFDGEVVAVEHRLGPDHGERVRVRGFDRAHRLRQRGEPRAHVDVTLGELLTTLATEVDLSARIEDDSESWPRVLQVGDSDLTLINRHCVASGLAWREESGELILFDPERDLERSVTWGQELIEGVITQDAARPAGATRVLGWDPVRRVSVETTAGSGPGDAELMAGNLYAHDAAADAAGVRRSARRAAAAASLRAVLRGDANWRPGIGVRVEGRSSTAPYRLTTVEHVLDPISGWVTLVDSTPLPGEPPAAGAQATGFTLAEVLDVDDPDTSGRVRVRLPALGDLESEWLPVLVPGAGGDDRGLVCLPMHGDLVVVLHGLADPGRGVVLGGLYADRAPDHAGVTSGSVTGYRWSGPDGQSVALTSEGDRVRLENASGSWLELGREGVELHAATTLTLNAPGQRLLIRADTVDFERG